MKKDLNLRLRELREVNRVIRFSVWIYYDKVDLAKLKEFYI
jgi:hypothetical protein